MQVLKYYDVCIMILFKTFKNPIGCETKNAYIDMLILR